MAIRSGRAISLKVIMRVEVAGLRGSGRNNKLALRNFPNVNAKELA